MIFKQLPTMVGDLNKLGIALKSLDAMKLGTVGVNLGNVEAYRAALKGLSVEQSVFALASKGATEEQIRQILVTNQATAEDVEAAMAKAGLTTATQALTQAEMVEMATKTGVAKATAEELLSKIGITATETGQIPVKKQVTRAMLEQAVASGTLTKAEASQIATMLGLNAVETANIGITNVLTASFTKLWAVITAHPIGAILTAIGAVAVGTIAYINKTTKEAEEAIVEAHENAKQALEDTKTSLSDDKSELQSVNSELETTKERLKEISSIGAPTLTEQNELTKLSTANAQLEAQQTLLENNIKLKQKAAALDAKELLGTQVEMEYSSILDGSSITSTTESYSYDDHAKYQASNLKNAYNIYMKALRDGDVKKQQLAQELIDASAGDSAVLTSELLEIVESFKYDDGTIIEGYEDLYNEYMGMIYNLQSLTNPDTFLEIAKLVTTGKGIDYEKAISEAYNLAYEGNFDVASLNQDFVKALADAGIDESTISYIFKLKQQEYQLLVDKINSKYDSSKVQYTYWDGEGKIHHDYEKENSAKADVEKVNQELNEYARENPIEFQLVSSYDEDFILLDKYIEEEKTKAENGSVEIKKAIEQELKELEQGGSVNLTLRPQIDTSELNDKGWDAGEGTATVFSSTYSNEAGDIAVNFTPIIADPKTGEYLGALSPDELQEYAEGVIAGTRKDDLNLQIGTKFEGEDAIKQAENSAIKVHELHEQFFLDSKSNTDSTENYISNAIQRIYDEAKAKSDDFGNEITVLSFNEKLAEIHTLTDGLSQLGEVYKDVADGGDFDFSSIINNEDFKNAFGSYTKEYDNFLKTVANSPDDMDACQEAFDRLASAYVRGSDKLKNLTSENRDYTISLLEQEGIVNAVEIVDSQLEAQRLRSKLSTEEMTDATYKEIETLLDEEKASDITRQALFDLIYAEDIFKNKDLSSNDKLKELEKLAVAFGVVTDAANKASYSMQIKSTIDALRKSGGFSESHLKSLEEQMSSHMLAQAENEYKDKFAELYVYDGGKYADDSSSKNSSKDSDTYFDHIETALSNMSDALSDLDGKVANTYSTWTERNKKLAESINKTKEAISLQNQAYQAYMREANAVGLSDSYKRLVQNGAMDISVIKDDKLADKISKYEDYYNKAKDALKSASELQNTLNELSSAEKWELFKGESDADISELDAYLDKAQNLIDKAELQGKFSNSSVYTDMLSLTTNKITDLRSQAEQLSSILGTMTQGTEAYDELFNELLSIRNQISDLENECIEFNNNIRNLNWEVFEYLEDSISRITDEMHYLIDLVANEDLFDDKGNRTKYADTTIALHAANYDVYKQMAQDYYEEVQSLQKELLNGGGKDVLEQYNEMLDKHRDMIKSANDEKQAILDLVENGMTARLDALNEIIDKYNELEDKQKSARDYQKDIENQVKNISSLERQLMAYQNDDSEEAKSKIQQITVDLEDARQQLEETEMDKNIQDRRELLESLSLEFQEWQNARLDNEDELLNQIIGNLQTEGDEINATLKEVADANGTLISGSITSIFDANSPFTNGLTSISDGVAGTTTAINNLIAQVSSIAGILTSTNAGTNDTNKGSANSSKPVTNNTVKPQTPTTTTTSNTNKQQTTPKVESKPSGSDIFIHKKDSYPKNKLKIENSVVDRLKKFDFDSSFQARATYYSKLGGSGAYKGSASQNVWMIKKMKEMGYKKGSSNIPYDQMNWVHDGEVILKRVSDGGYLTELTSGSKVLTKNMANNMYDWAKINPNVLKPNVNLPKMPEIQNRQASIQNVTVDLGGIVMNGVNDPEELTRQIRHTLATDSRTEKILDVKIAGRMLGKPDNSRIYV